jgi:hypothetical protein
VVNVNRQIEDSNKSLQRQTDDMKAQLELMGETEAQAAVNSNNRKLDLQRDDEELKITRQIADLKADTAKTGANHAEEIVNLNKALEELPDRYNEAAAAQGKLLTGMIDIRNEVGVANDAAGKFSDFMVQLFTQSGSAAQKFLKLIESIAAELISVFAKKYFLSMVAGVTGSGAIGAQAESVGQNTLSGAASSAVGNYLAGGTLGGTAVAGGFTGAFSAGYTANAAFLSGAAETAPVYGSIAGEMGGAMAGVTDVLAAIPVYGWIALAVIAIAAYLSGKGGGPKTGGSFMGSFDSSGSYAGSQTVPGTDNGRFFTPNDLDPQAKQAGLSFAAGYFAELGALGGRSQGASFGIGFDNDPQGTAQSRVSASVMIGGREVYSNRDVGVDDKAVPQEIALEISRGILAGLQNSDLEDGVKSILNMVVAKTATQAQIDAVLKLATEFKSLGDTITALSATPLENLKTQLKGLDDRVDAAKTSFNAALATNDPAQILNAEQTLKAAILDRYNTEINMAMQLKHAIDDLKDAAYQFSVSIDQKIIGAGGTADIAGESLTYASGLRSSVGGDFDPAGQMQSVQRYVGAIDNWYQARRSEIEKDAAAQQAQIQSMAQAEMANNRARIETAQKELQIVQQWKSVLEAAQQQITAMQLSDTNPLSAPGRFQLAKTNVDAARAAYEAAAPADKANAANKYLAALQDELKLLPEVFQRPSPEYQDIYNDIIKQLSGVKDSAQTQADRETELTQRLVDLQGEGNAIQSSAASAMQASNAQLDELNAQYVDYLTWAKGEAARLFTMQDTAYKDQLNALTGGEDLQIFIGQKQAEAVTLLTQIRDGITKQASGDGTTTPDPNDPGTSGSGTGAPEPAGGDDGGGGRRRWRGQHAGRENGAPAREHHRLERDARRRAQGLQGDRAPGEVTFFG